MKNKIFHKSIFAVIVAGMIMGLAIQAESAEKEADYRDVFCQQEGGVIEYRLPDNTSVDCLIEGDFVNIAVEVDWSAKYGESVGQAIWYSIAVNEQTGKRTVPAILLLTAKTKTEAGLERQIQRTIKTAKRAGIDLVFCMDADLSFYDCQNGAE